MKYITADEVIDTEDRDSLENPNSPLWKWDAGNTSSGVSMNARSSLQYSPVWRGVTLIARDVSKLPVFVYRLTETGKEKATTHPAYRLMQLRPNRNMTPQQFIQAMTFGVVMRGNSYAQIVRDAVGSPIELIPLDYDWVQPRLTESGLLFYEVKSSGSPSREVQSMQRGRTEFLRQDQMLHFRGPGEDGLAGANMIAFAADSFGLGKGAEDYSGRFFSNNARPSVVLEHPGQLSPEAAKRLRESFESIHRGIDNSHKTAILEEGLQLKPFSVNAEESQLLESRKFSIVDVANFLNLPPNKVGSDARTAFASLEEENRNYLDETLRPWLVALQQEMQNKLISERDQRAYSHCIKFDDNQLAKPKFEDQVNGINQLVMAGLISLDEGREMLGLNPAPDGVGATWLRPLNMQQVGPGAVEMPMPEPPAMDEPDDEAGDEETEDEASEAARSAFCGASRRVLRRLARIAERAAKAPESFVPSLDSLADHREFAADVLEPLEVLIRVMGGKTSDGRAVDLLFGGFTDRMLEAAETTSFDLPRSVATATEAAIEELPEIVIMELGK